MLCAKALSAAAPSGVVTGQNDDQLKQVMADAGARGLDRVRCVAERFSEPHFEKYGS